MSLWMEQKERCAKIPRLVLKSLAGARGHTQGQFLLVRLGLHICRMQRKGVPVKGQPDDSHVLFVQGRCGQKNHRGYQTDFQAQHSENSRAGRQQRQADESLRPVHSVRKGY